MFSLLFSDAAKQSRFIQIEIVAYFLDLIWSWCNSIIYDPVKSYVLDIQIF